MPSNTANTGLHPPSPSHLNLTHSNHRVTPSPPGSARLFGSFANAIDRKPPPSPGFAQTSFGNVGFPIGAGGRKHSAPTIPLHKKESGSNIQADWGSSLGLLKKASGQSLSKYREDRGQDPEPSSPTSSDRSERSSAESENESQASLTSLSSISSMNSSSSLNSEKPSELLPSMEGRHGRSDSVSSASSSGGPKTAYYTPPHTPTQAEVGVFPPSAHPSRGLKSHSSFFGYDEEGTGEGGVHGTGHPPNLNLSHLSNAQTPRRDEDEYEHPPTPRTARPEEESGSGMGFPKAPDGSGPLLPPALSEHGFYGQEYEEDEMYQRYSYSAYPASPIHEKASFGGSFGGSFGYPEHPYGDRERSTSFSSLYPPPSTDSVDSEGDGDDPMSFTVSTILPGFLFLGPEPTSWDHVKELKELGVRRIVNLAAECGPDDWGLGLDKPGDHDGDAKEVKEGDGSTSPKESGFEKYFKVPMRDTVEEDGIGRGVRVVCEMLVYVHCKAGKSRSVTAVIAYLIHANHWPLSKAYSFVLERRKGISPNIGFVSELMGFEEEELGGKSGGVSGAAWGAGKFAKHQHRPAGGAANLPQPSAPAATREEGSGGNEATGSSSNNPAGYGAVASTKRPGHLRESMPPPTTYAHHGYSLSVTEPSTTSHFLAGDGESVSASGNGSGSNSASSSTTASPELNGEYRAGASYGTSGQAPMGPSFPPLSAGGILALGDAAQELEVRDASGRYRHARRAPVNETTLQPMRRVSKAGLESGEFFYSDGKVVWGDAEDEEALAVEDPTNVKEV
ncbi:hypothetical protein GYMLUDRAFT_897852 [Collybiopsis luxurians FD-317 M1]|uniref:protein-tyrosine-phosphatase n=1 Tax=Collybiopsis luxurians FD-317 M1 TaxID=944289 RepID=A0A0D0AVU3_9AGAR|nr:hypothetical protein GYMLUDRAFT_897852 [Collybiopsis luxurians FD-317 M1]